MAKKDITGFPLPFGLKSNNSMFDADEYAGPYDTVQDALDTVGPAIREVGRMVGVYSDSSKRSVDIYRFEKDNNDDWILVSKDGAIYTGKVNEIDIVGTEIGLSQTIKDSINNKEDSFNKGSLIAGTNISLSGALANRLVGSGDITVNANVSGMKYMGTWDASENEPALSDSTGEEGNFYRVIEGGTADLGSGNITFVAGDDVIHNGVSWERAPAFNAGLGEIDASEVSYHNPSFPTVEAALDELLYVAPSITSFSNNSGSPVRMGKVITEVTFTWVINKGILTQSINQGVGPIVPNSLRTKTITGQNITSNRTYTLTVNDGSNTATKSTSISFLNDRYWGTSPHPTLTDAQITSLANKELNNSRGKTFTQNGNGEYIYYAWRKAAGPLGNMEVNGLDFTAYVIVTQEVTNSEGYKEDYYVLRIDDKQYGTLHIKIS